MWKLDEPTPVRSRACRTTTPSTMGARNALSRAGSLADALAWSCHAGATASGWALPASSAVIVGPIPLADVSAVVAALRAPGAPTGSSVIVRPRAMGWRIPCCPCPLASGRPNTRGNCPPGAGACAPSCRVDTPDGAWCGGSTMVAPLNGVPSVFSERSRCSEAYSLGSPASCRPTVAGRMPAYPLGPPASCRPACAGKTLAVPGGATSNKAP